MNTKLLAVGTALALTLSQVIIARETSEFTHREPNLTKIKWMGTLRCEDQETAAQHKNDHNCDLEFVNETNGEVWNVKKNPTLTSIHQKNGKDAKVHIDAMRSPRYLFGTSYVDIKRIETLPLEAANTDTKPELNSKLTHVCSLDTDIGQR